MAWSMLLFALFFLMPESSAARVPLVSVMAIVFTLFYAPTAGTSPFSISAEVSMVGLLTVEQSYTASLPCPGIQELD